MKNLISAFALALVALANSIAPAAALAASASDDIRLAGAGATFPQPLYERWVVEYQKLNPSVKIDYQGLGSGGGIKAITDKTVAFAASDSPLTKKEIEAMGGADKILEFPSCVGGVVVAYNLPGVTTDLNITGALLADIFIGKVSKWNDPKIAELNPGANLPDLPIVPGYRTDGSGTTSVFTNYLATQSEEFKSTVGVGKQVKWPFGQGGKGNPGVAAILKSTSGSIGYIEHNYAVQNNLASFAVKNASGKFVKGSPAAMAAASTAAVDNLKANRLVADIWNQPGDEVYPISSFTYLIVYRDLNNLKSPEEARALFGFLSWTLSGGQELAKSLDYAPLGEGIRAKAAGAVKALTHNGASLAASK